MNFTVQKSVLPDEKVALMRADARFEIAVDGEQRAVQSVGINAGLGAGPGAGGGCDDLRAGPNAAGGAGSAGGAGCAEGAGGAGYAGGAGGCGVRGAGGRAGGGCVASVADVVNTSSVPKMFLSNDCAFNCAYCGCRRSFEEKTRYRTEPRELAELAYAQIGKGSPGVFVTSAVLKNPDYTEELIIETLRILRQDMRYTGYLHAKIMPGTDPLLIRQAGRYANRLSVNIEVAKSEGYKLIAKNKNKANILGPMEDISKLIGMAKHERRAFATSQTTQLMAGSLGEDDRTILNLSGALYKKYKLSRVYYTAFNYQYKAKGYEDAPLRQTPPWRMHRLYQADRLMQLYGFTLDEVTTERETFLDQHYDPKAAWALRNMQFFPVEINKADREELLRVPGIGMTGVERILAARRFGPLSFETLKRAGISLRRCKHFITCGGRFYGSFNEFEIRGSLTAAPAGEQLSFVM